MFEYLVSSRYCIGTFEVLAVKFEVPAQASPSVYHFLYDIDLILLHTAETEQNYITIRMFFFGSKGYQCVVLNMQLFSQFSVLLW